VPPGRRGGPQDGSGLWEDGHADGDPAADPGHDGDPASPAGRGSGIRYPRIVIRTDGAARGNPGPASLGAVLIDGRRADALDPAAAPMATISEALGRQTNNVAEWTGVIRALALAEELGAEVVDLFLDSMLIVQQLHGQWRVKDPKLQPLWADARARLGHMRRWSATHVPRAQNHQADALANEALDRVAIGGPRVVVRRPDRDEPPD
jgi:ribonuclease HI